MTDTVRQVIDRMCTSQRPELLMLLAATITQMTILGRCYYDDEIPRAIFVKQMKRSIASRAICAISAIQMRLSPKAAPRR